MHALNLPGKHRLVVKGARVIANLDGLTKREVADRVGKGLSNDLPSNSGKSVGDILRSNIFTRINAILGVLLVIVALTGSWMNCAFGLLIIANSIIGIIQELRAKKTLDKLAVVADTKPMVRRAEATRRIDKTAVVVDDIIEVGPGDQIVVDGVLVESENLNIDESLLTGESEPESKALGDEVLSGSYVISGSGAYRATKVGSASYAAQITEQAAKFSLAHSELQAGINKILRVITWILIPVGIATIAVQLTQTTSGWRSAVLRMAGAIVPMVPEGLVLITATAFALGIIRLGKRNCLVQELPAIEGLARVDVLCADKTGTLTDNKMSLRSIETLGNFDELLVNDVLATMAEADPYPNSSMQAIKNAVGIPSDQLEVVSRIPFSSVNKFSGIELSSGESWILGAPDILADGSAEIRAEELGKTGLRVLLLGMGTPARCEPAALVVLSQTIRSDAQETLDYFADQGVEVKVISGDNAKAVGAVTNELGIDEENPLDLAEVKDDDLVEAATSHRVFGRVKPQQKRMLVKALQKAGHTVAMTGDGVNDILALKDSDLGIAMGSGAPATRSAAKIVLLDDKFSTLPHVVGEGRRVLGNIERVAKLFLTKTVYSAILALLVVIWRLPFPFQPIHITITGWFTIGIPAFLLSLATNNDRARPGFVKRVLAFGLPAGCIVGAATFVTYLLGRHFFPQQANQLTISTGALVCLIFSATWLLAVVARPYNWWRICLILAAYFAYGAIFALRVLHSLFKLDTSNIQMIILGTVVGAIGAGLIEVTWRLLQRFRERQQA